MIPAAFDYYRAKSIQEAFFAKQQAGADAKWIAGGHSLLPMMKLRLATPPALIDINEIDGLSGIRLQADGLVIGALTHHAEIAHSEEVVRTWPLLAQAAGLIGDRQVRNRGTIGGNLAHADPASDLPAVALALEATLVAEGPSGRREIPASEFFVGPMTTALSDDELLTQVRFPVPSGKVGSFYCKYPHPASGYAVVGVAAVAQLGPDGKFQAVRVGVTGVGMWAYRAETTEKELVGKLPTQENIASAAQHAVDETDVSQDLFASEQYRTHLAALYTVKALQAAVQAIQ
ncbi:MAG: xanthine dehydrogenase family protein subunit M [Firmicutes bacterium]|nr:xanthine dehydrogenase family protein subunit M [Bacillota bacterium]